MAEQDRLAAGKIIAARPIWTSLIEAKAALDLPPMILLHAGPPFGQTSAITRPILNAAIHAACFEGWASTAQAAEAMILAGEIGLQPAQDWQVCVPLAFVLSPAMWLQTVEDGSRLENRAYAPINAGMILPLAHGGSGDPAVIERHRWVNETLVPLLDSFLSEPVDLLAIIDQSLRGGDECHGRTGVGAAELAKLAQTRMAAGEGRTALVDFLNASPGFFLFLAMAAAKCMLMAAERTEGSNIVTSAGGNGRQFGIKLAGKPEQWFMADCDPPQGPFFDGGDVSTKNPLGGIGDSAVIDALGLGGMALEHTPELAQALAAHTPPNNPEQVLETPHPGLLDGQKRVGLNARKMLETDQNLHAVLGILDADGKSGIIGRGLFQAPLSVFARALA